MSQHPPTLPSIDHEVRSSLLDAQRLYATARDSDSASDWQKVDELLWEISQSSAAKAMSAIDLAFVWSHTTLVREHRGLHDQAVRSARGALGYIEEYTRKHFASGTEREKRSVGEMKAAMEDVVDRYAERFEMEAKGGMPTSHRVETDVEMDEKEDDEGMQASEAMESEGEEMSQYAERKMSTQLETIHIGSAPSGRPTAAPTAALDEPAPKTPTPADAPAPDSLKRKPRASPGWSPPDTGSSPLYASNPARSHSRPRIGDLLSSSPLAYWGYSSVIFEVENIPTPLDEHVVLIVGFCEELGGWEPSRGLKMAFDVVSRTWTAEAQIPVAYGEQSRMVSYKAVILTKEDPKIRWSPNENWEVGVVANTQVIAKTMWW